MPVLPQTVTAIRDGLAQAGLDLRRLPQGPIVDDEGLATLWRHACARAGRTSVPLEVGLAMPLGAMGALDYLGASSSTVAGAVTIAQELFALVAPGVQLAIDRTRRSWRVRIVNQPPFPGEADSDLLIVGILLARLRAFSTSGLDLPLVELAVPRPPPREEPAFHALVRAPLVFDRRHSALHFSTADWSHPLRTADPRLLATLRASVAPGVRRGNDAVLVAVRALVARALPRVRTLHETARDLGHSGRSLQRRLARSDTSWAEVVDSVRRDRAEALVADGGLSLAEVAHAIGFAEPASFTRAWRRWFGHPPSQAGRQKRSQ